MPLDPSPAQVPLLRTSDGYVAGYVQKFGVGHVVVLADPLVLCNGYLEKADNGMFLLLDLLRGASRCDRDVRRVSPRPDRQRLRAAVLGHDALGRGAAVAPGRGVRRPRAARPAVRSRWSAGPAEVARSDAEWSVAVGQLLRRSSARAVTLGLLATATERAVATQTGLPLQPRERFWNALWVRAPEVAGELAEVESSLSRGVGHRGRAAERGAPAPRDRAPVPTKGR